MTYPKVILQKSIHISNHLVHIHIIQTEEVFADITTLTRILEKQVTSILTHHKELLQAELSVTLRLLSKVDIQDSEFAAQIQYHESAEDHCVINISARYFDDHKYEEATLYRILTHEFAHWHDRDVMHQYGHATLYPTNKHIKLFSAILHTLRVEGYANLRMYYARSHNDLVDPNPHHTNLIAKGFSVTGSYVENVRQLHGQIRGLKHSIERMEPEDLYKWISSFYYTFYYLGSMMCYFIVFYHLREKSLLSHIQLKTPRGEVKYQELPAALSLPDLHISKIPLEYVEYSLSEIHSKHPFEFYELYLHASKYIGINNKKFLIFEDHDYKLMKKHKDMIDRFPASK